LRSVHARSVEHDGRCTEARSVVGTGPDDLTLAVELPASASIATSVSGFGSATGIAVLPDDRIVVAGASDGRFALARYLGS
jgi:hypothetical protein